MSTNDTALSAFKSEIESTLNKDQIISDRKQIDSMIDNVSGYTTKALLIIYPESTEQVQKIVNAANKHKVLLHPYSTGKNWGLGSKLPSTPNMVLIELSRMNQIIKVDEDFGIAIIEPGVTQFQLYNHLNSTNSNFMADTTGSGKDTSILGNALDKGMGYNLQRAKQLLNVEVVLGDGTLLKTGFGHYENTRVKDVFPDGIGPSLCNMFLQSNFGIVVKATISLRRKPEKRCMFMTYVKRKEDVGKILDELRVIKQKNLINSVVHYYETIRAENGLAPVMYQELSKNGISIKRETITKFLKRWMFGEGMFFGNISGTKQQIKAAKKELRSLRKYGLNVYITDGLIKLGKLMTKIFFMKKFHAYVTAGEGFYKMSLGEPSDRPIMSLYWPVGTNLPADWEDPDQTNVGMSFITPTVPMKSNDVTRLANIISDVNSHYKIVQASYAFGLMDDKCCDISISTHFNRENNNEKEESIALTRELNQKLIENGYHPRRIHVKLMDLIIDPNDNFWQVTRKIKSAVDPEGIISPGHFNLE